MAMKRAVEVMSHPVGESEDGILISNALCKSVVGDEGEWRIKKGVANLGNFDSRLQERLASCPPAPWHRRFSGSTCEERLDECASASRLLLGSAVHCGAHCQHYGNDMSQPHDHRGSLRVVYAGRTYSIESVLTAQPALLLVSRFRRDHERTAFRLLC
jgi:hypothetical protein